MRQIWISREGSPEELEVRKAPDPEPKPGQIRVLVEAAGVNFADIMARLGLYPDRPALPVVVGYEVAGRVDQIGAGVDPAWLGQDVLALTRFGGYSDVVCMPESQAFERPAGMTALEGAAFPVNYLTAHQLLVVMGNLRPRETVLVHSAGGGVGLAATQIALGIGAEVIGAASAHKHEYLRSIGIAHCIDARTEDFEQRTNALTEGCGVDLVIDAAGGASFQKSYRALGPAGRLGVFGISAAVTGRKRRLRGLFHILATMPWLHFNPVRLMNDNKAVFGVNLGHLWGEANRIRGWMEQLLDGYRAGTLHPVIAARFPFERAAEAHHYLQDRKNLGKVLLVP